MPTNFFDLHRHDEFSFFDGFGKATECAKKAKELGYPALGLSNHGNISGLVKHWQACKEQGIKPILGCEVYFQPVYNKKDPQRKSYHLCLFVKNLQGYKNLCHLLTEANTEQFYYKPIVDFKLLEKYKDGLICTTACIASAMSQAINNGNTNTAEKLLLKYKEIFGKDLYVEIQPYKIDDEQTQEGVNLVLMKLARKHKVKCILTSDSHYTDHELFDTYCKMHQIGGNDLAWVQNTYSDRYMPSESDIQARFVKMYAKRIKNADLVAERLTDNMREIYEKVEDDILSQLEMNMPKIGEDIDSYALLKQKVKEGLKKRGKWNKEHKERCAMELDTIHYHGFDDYFLMVQDYVNFARNKGIPVGPGRGSACNCDVAYALHITDVDSIKYRLDFSRFMRKEKKKMPRVLGFTCERMQKRCA